MNKQIHITSKQIQCFPSLFGQICWKNHRVKERKKRKKKREKEKKKERKGKKKIWCHRLKVLCEIF